MIINVMRIIKVFLKKIFNLSLKSHLSKEKISIREHQNASHPVVDVAKQQWESN